MSVRIISNELPRMRAQIPALVDVTTRKAAYDIQGLCEAYSRVDTGAMKGGWSVRFPGPMKAVVYNPIDYAIHNELGTRRMSAQPMAQPAVERVGPTYTRAVQQTLRDMR